MVSKLASIGFSEITIEDKLMTKGGNLLQGSKKSLFYELNEINYDATSGRDHEGEKETAE